MCLNETLSRYVSFISLIGFLFIGSRNCWKSRSVVCFVFYFVISCLCESLSKRYIAFNEKNLFESKR